jgi:TRAP-type C4-dicarboxylate transport system permease small subunit
MDRAGDILLIGLNAAMVAIVLGAVFFRYVLNDSLSWSDELVRYLFVWFSLLGSALVLREREHIRVEYFVEKFPPRLRRAVEVAMAAGVCLFHAALTVLGVLWVWATRGTVTSALQWPLNLFFYAALPVASLLSLAYALRRLRRGELTERDTSDRTPAADPGGGPR